MGTGRCYKCCKWVDIDEVGRCKECGEFTAQPQVYVIDHNLVYCPGHGNVEPNSFGGCSICVPDTMFETLATT